MRLESYYSKLMQSGEGNVHMVRDNAPAVP